MVDQTTKMTRYRIRDIPAIPLLALLHVLFILSSLVVRLFESLHPPRSFKQEIQPPRHVAIVLTAENSPSHPVSSPYQARLRFAVVESVRRSVEWASEEGIAEISLWNKDGLLQQCRHDILEHVVRLPPSPPHSGPSSPSKGSVTLRSTDMLSPEAPSSSHSFTVYTSTSRPIMLHLLPTSASTLIPSLTQRYLQTGRSLDSITQKSLDSDVRSSLGFRSDPDLLLIHPLAPLPLLRALLPRSPPELHGYPFWTLRITEIYQHPTRLPFPVSFTHSLTGLVGRAQLSSLPLLRKAARLFPITDSMLYERSIQGVISRNEWEGAMSAWVQVEQRSGR